MPAVPRLSLVLPAYNEARTIVATLTAIRSYLDGHGLSFEIIVAADGDDGTREAARMRAAEDPRITVIGGPERGGKGRAIRNAVAAARGEIVGFLDADYKTKIDEVEKLLPWLDQGYEVVIGSRALADSRLEVRQPLYRRLGSTAFGLVMHGLLGLRDIKDTQCGFKFFQGRAARVLFARQRVDGYMFDVEILRLARQLGYRIQEVGITWRDDGDTRYDPLVGTWRNMRELLRIRFTGPSASPAAEECLVTSENRLPAVKEQP